jgi:hypothetical protein
MARTVDFTGVGDFTPAPIGTYTMVGKEFKWRDNADGSGEHCAFQWSIEDEMAADGTTKVAGKVLFVTYSPKQNALWKLRQDALAAGLDETLFDGPADLDIIIPALVGRRVLMEIGISEYEDKKGNTRFRNEWIDTMPASSNEDSEAAEALSSGAGRRR